MNRNYNDEISDPRTLTLDHSEHDNGYVEDCDECTQEELRDEEQAVFERLSDLADRNLEAMVALFMVDGMNPVERRAAERVFEGGK